MLRQWEVCLFLFLCIFSVETLKFKVGESELIFFSFSQIVVWFWVNFHKDLMISKQPCLGSVQASVDITFQKHTIDHTQNYIYNIVAEIAF